MKKLLILFLLLSSVAYAQKEPLPSGTTPLTQAAWSVQAADSSAWLYTGTVWKAFNILSKYQADKLYAPIGGGGSFVTTSTNQTSGLTGNKTWAGAHNFMGGFTLGNGAFGTSLNSAASNQTIAFPPLSGTLPIFAATPTSGGIVGWSGTSGAITSITALPNGTTATTQSVGDSTTKVATTAFVTAASAGLPDSLLKKANRDMSNVASGAIANAKLANSSVTIGTTSVSLGGTASSIAGLGSVGLLNGAFNSTLSGQASADRTIKFQNKSYTVADSATVAPATTGSFLLYGNGSGGFSNAAFTFLNDSTMLYRTKKYLHNDITGQNPSGTDFSTFLGYRAGESFLSGSQGYANTGIGRGALLNLQSNVSSEASSNTAVGHNAGRFLDIGTGNTLIGTAAGDALTISNSVTGVGWHVFNQATNATNSTAVGNAALYSLNTNTPSAIVGYLGGFSISTGANNSGVGPNVLQNRTTGSYGSALGASAGLNSNGDNTVHIGRLSDSGTGSDLILIGSEVKPSSWNASGEINIGNVIRGSGVTLDSVANVNAKIGIGIDRVNGIAGRRIESYIANGSAPSADSIGVRRQVNFLANSDGYINNSSQLGFGYTTISSAFVPAAIGYVTTNQGGQTYGDLVFATRSVNTDSKPPVRLRIASNGAIQFPAYTTAGVLTSDASGNINTVALSGLTSGTYTPTSSNTVNISSITVNQFLYTRIGNVANVSGRLTITPSATGTVQFRLTQPVSSDFATDEDALGGGFGISGANGFIVNADPTNDLSTVSFTAASTSSQSVNVNWTYIIK